MGVLALWFSLVLWFLTFVTGGGLHSGPRYQGPDRHCSSARECKRGLHEVCWRLHEGCSRGLCMCDPDYTVRQDTGYCKPLKLGGEQCTERDACPDTMDCQNGTCRCKVGVMNRHHDLCVLPHERMLGNTCDPAYDHTQCIHRSKYGYSSSDIECSHRTGKCACSEGFSASGHTCLKLNINDYGCRKAFHCQGGAICAEERCVCPTGYRAVSKGTKCARTGAITGLPVGEQCDEVNENRYCGHGLVCHLCAGDRRNKCVKYVLSNKERQPHPSHAPPSRPGVPLLLTLLLAALTLRAAQGHGRS